MHFLVVKYTSFKDTSSKLPWLSSKKKKKFSATIHKQGSLSNNVSGHLTIKEWDQDQHSESYPLITIIIA